MNQTEETVQSASLPFSLPLNPQVNTFFLSQAQGFNGQCSDSVGVGFMQDVMHDNTCSQVITDLQSAASTILSAKTYYSPEKGEAISWGVAAGIGKSTKGAVRVEPGQVWTFDADTLRMEKKKERGEAGTATDWQATYSATGTTCTVTNALKEAYYEVRYQPVIDPTANSELYGYKVVSVVVDVVLQKEL